MREGFFKSVKNFFGKNNSPPKTSSKEQSKRKQIVSFGGREDSGKKEVFDEDVDNRYSLVETRLSWKELGIKRDQAVQGEIPILVDNKFVLSKISPGHYIEITLILSDYQMFMKTPEKLVHFALGKIDKLHKYTNKENHHKLMIGLKDGRLFKFRITTQTSWKKIYDYIETFAFVKVKKHFFAFKHHEFNHQIEDTFRGWKVYNLIKQFMRLGVQLMPHSENSISEFTSDFKILDNRDGRVCSTYPEQIIVPSRMPYDCLVRCSKFRSRSRMPALTYLYQWKEQQYSGLYRSSQSKVGFSNSRSPEDEMMLRMIGNPREDPKGNIVLKVDGQTVNKVNCIIYDARNKMAAFGNKVAGKGYEPEEFYPNCKVQFLNIPNIHAVRESYIKAVRASQGDDSKFYSSLADSEWYDYIFTILEGSTQVARSLAQGQNVLVHCSDGWDRTSQLCSIAGILLDPFYRTIIGFHILIQKDWMRFGHQFALRMGQGVNNPNGDQKSPVFLQFLDCVSQLLYQYPTDFQFNYRYLQDIAEMATTNLFGNFLCNCEQQIIKYELENKTVSLWSYLLKNRQQYLNPYYFQAHSRLHPSTAQKHFRFWKQHFLQYVDGFQDIYDIYSCKFTQDNLQIMYKHLKQEKGLLQQKLGQNQQILEGINQEIKKLEV